MKRCKCGSYAINEDSHGRAPGVDTDLCDVCYWRTRANSHQAQIDELMLEYCLDEMTPGQVTEWGEHQKPVPPNDHAVGRPAQERATGEVVLREIAAMHAEGLRTLRANTLAERLWPGRRQHNANGQVFPLGAAVAARLLRRCPAVCEKEWRLWEILPHRLPANAGVERSKDD